MSIVKGLILALCITLFLKVATVVPALVLANIVDTLALPGQSLSALLWLFLVLIVVQALLTPLQAWCLARLCQDRVRSLSARWCRDLLDKRFETYGKLHGGTLVKVLDRGITAQERWLGFLIGSAWPVLAETLVLGGLFVYLGAGEVLLGLLPLSLAYLWINSLLVRWRRPHIEAVNAREDDLAEQWVDTFASAVIVKLESAQNAAMKPVEQTLGRYADAAVRVAGSGGALQAARILFIGLGSGALLAWGMNDQAQSKPSLSLGELVALFTLVSGLLAGVAQLAEAWRMLDQFRADRQKLDHWLALPTFGSPSTAPISSTDGEAGLRLEPCSLWERDELRLNLSTALTICMGERVALAGPSGAGKSTLLHALAGTLQPLRQYLHLAGQAVENLDASSQFSRLRLCPQGPRFIPGLLPRAVLLDQPHEPARIEQWLASLGLDHDWYGREIDARAESISGGEARRLSLLRILNRPGEFNLFDEPTSGLDTVLAQRTWDVLFETLEGRGLICVTHDRNALARFDWVIWMEDGQIISIEAGSHYL